MSGNVWEGCWDWNDSYTVNAQSNPCGPDSGTYRIRRGGSSAWSISDNCARVSCRTGELPTINNSPHPGFRIARSE